MNGRNQEKDMATLRSLVEDPLSVVWEMTQFDAFTLISQVQLALRHPLNSGPSSIIAQNLITALATLLIAKHPDVGDIIQAGFDQEQDHGEYSEEDFDDGSAEPFEDGLGFWRNLVDEDRDLDDPEDSDQGDGPEEE